MRVVIGTGGVVSGRMGGQLHDLPLESLARNDALDEKMLLTAAVAAVENRPVPAAAVPVAPLVDPDTEAVDDPVDALDAVLVDGLRPDEVDD
jgi:hypothetical protein